KNASGSSNPLTVLVSTNLSIQANFAERLTTNYPTPLWWLAANGYSNFQSAVTTTGANGIPVWQSYQAGLNPADAKSQLKLSMARSETANVLTWSPVANRLYTILSSTNAAIGFAPVAGAINLPATTPGFTDASNPSNKLKFYKLSVRLP
ncbi:MAG: hypothetical protein ABIV39_04295, partial [Verrucomicrobiota bacterium]